MSERHRKAIETFLIIGLILAMLIAYVPCSPVSIILGQPTPTASLPATPALTTQLTQPAEVTHPIKAISLTDY